MAIPEDDTEVCCGDEIDQETNTTPVSPDQGIIPGDVAFCTGTGLGPDGLTPPTGETWL